MKGSRKLKKVVVLKLYDFLIKCLAEKCYGNTRALKSLVYTIKYTVHNIDKDV